MTGVQTCALPISEGGERGEQAGAGGIGREKRAADLRCEECIGDEIVELNGVAEGDRDYMPGGQSRWCGGAYAILPF